MLLKHFHQLSSKLEYQLIKKEIEKTKNILNQIQIIDINEDIDFGKSLII
jgi:superfamily II RNA helicase